MEKICVSMLFSILLSWKALCIHWMWLQYIECMVTLPNDDDNTVYYRRACDLDLVLALPGGCASLLQTRLCEWCLRYGGTSVGTALIPIFNDQWIVTFMHIGTMVEVIAIEDSGFVPPAPRAQG